jgi:hypothetical protein
MGCESFDYKSCTCLDLFLKTASPIEIVDYCRKGIINLKQVKMFDDEGLADCPFD